LLYEIYAKNYNCDALVIVCAVAGNDASPPRVDLDSMRRSSPPIVFRRYPALPLFERVELQWRLEMLRHEPVSASVWQTPATQGGEFLEKADTLTIWMDHWIGLAFARAGDTTKAHQSTC
jgi:hypothetical protein